MLGKHYEAAGQPLDASRAHLKSMEHGGPYRVPAHDAVREFFRSMLKSDLKTT